MVLDLLETRLASADDSVSRYFDAWGLEAVWSWCSANPWGVFVIILYWLWVWYSWERVSPKNSYWSVVSSWWTLNVSHRREASHLATFLQQSGVPVQIFVEQDANVVGAGALALIGYAAPGVRRHLRRRQQEALE